MLKLENVGWTTEDGVQVVKGVNIEIPDGKVVVITGPNGGGKTSLAKLIAGIYKPTSGRIYLDDEDITDMSITERANKGISYAFQQPVRFKGLEVRDLHGLRSNRNVIQRQNVPPRYVPGFGQSRTLRNGLH